MLRNVPTGSFHDMSLASSAYYLIKPTQSLVREVTDHPTDYDYLLTEPVLWDRLETTGDTSPRADRLAYVKAIFLAWLYHQNLDGLESNAYGDFERRLERMLGPEPFTPEVFDRWWTIEWISNDTTDEREDVLPYITAESLRKVTAPRVDYANERLRFWTEQTDRTKKGGA
jgi:hypothetical protein